MIWMGKPKYSEKSLSHAHFIHHKLMCTGLGLNMDLSGERLETDCLNHGMAAVTVMSVCHWPTD
jgi:hypothetical protein